jgi:hypothetical protein
VSLGFPAASRSSVSAFCLRFSPPCLLVPLVRFMSRVRVGLLCAPPVPTTGLLSVSVSVSVSVRSPWLVVAFGLSSCRPCMTDAGLLSFHAYLDFSTAATSSIFVDPSIHPPVSVGAVIFSQDIFLASIYSTEADSFTTPGSTPRLRVALCGCVACGSCSLPAFSRRHQLSQWPRPHFVFPPVCFDLILGCCTHEHFMFIQEGAGPVLSAHQELDSVVESSCAQKQLVRCRVQARLYISFSSRSVALS